MLNSDIPAATDFFLQAQHLGARALQDVRTSVSTPSFDPLNGQPLTTAIAHLIQEFRQTTTLQVDWLIEPPPQLALDISIALYRILQEALTNITRHSAATTVFIQLIESQATLFLLVRDNGKGFTPRMTSTGFGLQSMHQRAIALNGQWRIISEPGAGCLVTVQIPLHPHPPLNQSEKEAR